MSSVWENISDVLARIAQLFGIKPSEAKRLEALREKLTASRATNADQLETLKDEIRKLETRAKQKKKEFDEARGDIKRMVGREIEGIFRDLDRLHGRENIITENVERLSALIAKLHEGIVARDHGIESGQITDVEMVLEEDVRLLEELDAERAHLEKVNYQPPQRDTFDVSQRVDQLEGEEETDHELSESTLKRLKALEEA